MRSIRSATPFLVAALVAVLCAGCASAPEQAPPLAVDPSGSSDGAAATPGPDGAPDAPLVAGAAGASCLDQAASALGDRRYGQLVMAGVPAAAVGAASRKALREGIGGIIVTDGDGVPAATVSATVEAAQAARTPAGAPGLLVSTDQEGGQVQELDGAGFGAIPPAVRQGTDGGLEAAARGWGTTLRRAGVDVDLAPVADVVDPDLGTANAPVGKFGRQYGTDVASAGTGVRRFVGGMRQAGVAPTLKHFPGLGKVRQNTDFAGGVVDPTTTADDADLGSFAQGIAAGAPIVMMSSARYPRIDTEQALFSSKIMNGVLRGDLKFPGVIMTDDVGAAAALADTPVDQRATRFVAAGGDLVLTVVPDDAEAMVDALRDRAKADPAGFGARADDAVRRVLALKRDQGLLCR